jgi:hypothetical protein
MFTLTSLLSVYASQNIDKDQEVRIEENLSLKQVGEIAFDVINAVLVEDDLAKEHKYQKFKDNYAGSKIDDQGKLVVYVSQKGPALDALKDELSCNNVNSDDVQFIEVRYSYSELKKQQISMWNFRNKTLEGEGILKEWADKIVSMPVDPSYNCVLILVNDFVPSDYSLCKEYFGEYSYRIESVAGNGEIIEEITTIKPGQSISTGGSMGFRCKLDGVEGFVTAIHTASYSGINPISVGGTNIGAITDCKYDGKSDFAFVEITNSNYTAGRITNTSPSRTLHASHYVVALPQGYTVYMAGGTTTNIREGEVEYYDYAIASGTEWLVCSYPSSGGDSGGVIFAEVNGDYCVVGIHDGSISISGTTMKYGTKLTTMKDYYNIVIY